MSGRGTTGQSRATVLNAVNACGGNALWKENAMMLFFSKLKKILETLNYCR